MHFDPFRRIAEISDLIIDPKVGIIPYLTEQPREPGTAAFFHFAAQASRTDAFTPFRNFRSTGGAATTREMATARSVGEAVERYCCAIVDLDEFPIHSADQAPFEVTDPHAFELYGRTQYGAPDFRFVPFRCDTSVRWCKGIRAHDGADIRVPAAMVYVPYIFYQGRGDHAITQPNSTGLGAHMSYAEAAIGGVCEAIERDSFSITWQAMLRPPRIARDSLRPEQIDRLSRFERLGATVTLVDLTTDLGVPTVMAIQRNRQPGVPPLTFAAATELDPHTAVNKALDELAHTMRYMLHLTRRLPPMPEVPGHTNVVDQETHLGFWCSQERAEHAAFLMQGTVERGVDELPRITGEGARGKLAALVARLRDAGFETVLVDVTSPDVHPLGFRVVRAIVPGLHPLFWNHRYRSLGGTRLRTVPEFLGQRPVLDEADNPFPHPYP